MRILRRGSLRRVAAILVVLVMVVAAGCGGGGGQSGSGADLSDASFAVGSKEFNEQRVLGYITLLALEDAGASVDDRTGIQTSAATRQELLSGNIDMYWEYTGTIWIDYLGHTDPILNSQKQYEAAAKEDLKENDLKLLEPAPFNNTYALAIREEAYEEVGVEKLSDLPELVEENPDEATICVERDTEFDSRYDGLPEMEETYNFEFPQDNVSILDTGRVYDQADQGNPCNFGEVFTTDGRIAALGLEVIEDDKSFFPIYNPALEVRKETYNEYGKELDEIFTPIAQALDTRTMTELNRRVDVDGERPEDVAKDWLQQNDFIE